LLDYLRETNEASGVNIQLERKNVFCFDNEAFRYLMIMKDKNRPVNFELSDDEVRQFEDSWTQSRNASLDLIKYVDTLEPMEMSELVAFNAIKKTNQDWALRTRETIEKLLKLKIKINSFHQAVPTNSGSSTKNVNKPEPKYILLIFNLFEILQLPELKALKFGLNL
jgi:hypothetical protein